METLKCNGILVSSTVELSRNIEKYNFPWKLQRGESIDISDEILEILKEEFNGFEIFKTYLGELEYRNILQGLSTKKFGKMSVVVCNETGDKAIVLNDIDHVRIQYTSKNLDLVDGHKWVNSIDDILEEKVDYAFSDELGYLTSYLRNCGSLFRASVILRLSGLEKSGKLVDIQEIVSKKGFMFNPAYNKLNDKNLNMYEISTKYQSKLSEVELIESIDEICREIILKEALARDTSDEINILQIKDKVFRSLAILRNALIINMEETLNLIDDVKNGIKMGIIDNISLELLDELRGSISSISILSNKEYNLEEKDEDVIRAEIIKYYLNE